MWSGHASHAASFNLLVGPAAHLRLRFLAGPNGRASCRRHLPDRDARPDACGGTDRPPLLRRGGWRASGRPLRVAGIRLDRAAVAPLLAPLGCGPPADDGVRPPPQSHSARIAAIRLCRCAPLLELSDPADRRDRHLAFPPAVDREPTLRSYIARLASRAAAAKRS